MRVGRPSPTARWVAARRLGIERTRAATPSGDVRGEHALYRDVGGVLALVAGRSDRWAQRTSFVDNEIAGAIGRGVEQMVLVGAGYDGRALRFAGNTRWFEVDRPDTQNDKQRRLGALGHVSSSVSYVGLDLLSDGVGTNLDAALDAAGHRADAPSVFVCEGVFPHLTLHAAASVCETLRARAPAGSVLVSTYLVFPEEAGGPGQAARVVADQLLRALGQRRRSEFLEGDPEKLLVVTGWRTARSQRGAGDRVRGGAYVLTLAAEPATGPVP